MTPTYEKHPDFNDSLDEEGTVEIAGATFRRSHILCSLDPTAYEQALDEWREQQLQPLRDAIAELRKIRQNGRRLDELAKAVQLGSVVPFVGAGLTVPCGMPAWTSFLVDSAVHAGLDRDLVTAQLADGGYEEVAEEVIAKLGEPGFNEMVKGRFAEPSRILGSIARLPKFATGCVITTNFDGVLESVYKEAGTPFAELIVGSTQTGFGKALANKERYLLKLHGNAKDPRSRVLTMTEYWTAYGEGAIDFTRELPKSLKKAFAASRLLFLGCSLATDRTMALFKEVVAQEGSHDLPEHFALLEQPAGDEVAVRERFLNDRHIFPIWFPAGDFTYLEAVTALLARDL